MDVNISHFIGLIKILELMKKGEVKSIISYTVKDEFLKNESSVSVELERNINKLIQKNERFINILEVLGISYEFQLFGIENTQLLKSIKNCLQEFVLESILLE